MATFDWVRTTQKSYVIDYDQSDSKCQSEPDLHRLEIGTRFIS